MNPISSPLLTVATDQLKAIVANSLSRIDVLQSFGLRPFGSNYERLDYRLKKEGISTAHFASQSAGLVKVNRARRQPIENLLVEHSRYNKQRLKERLLQRGLLKPVCVICAAPATWRNQPLVLILDHINGVHNDDRLSNLRLVCPNCNSQLPTFCGRNKRKRP
jgi:hypothetical protein